MSVADLKSIMHRRIDQLTDEVAVADLFQTMNTFLEGRLPDSDSESLEQIARLKHALARIEAGERGISTDELIQKMQQWRTR
jgi:hypothetical protein